MARMKAKTAVERCREKYPSMTQAVYSMARNPEKYGIRFTPEARQLAGYPSTKELDRASRAKPNRVNFRMDDRTWAKLKKFASEYDMTMQAVIEEAVLTYYGIEEDENADL